MAQPLTANGLAWDDDAAPATRMRTYWQSTLYRLRHDPVTLFFGTAVLLIVAMALLAPWLAPFDPYKESVIARLKPWGWRGHLLGTDELGRDMVSRLIYGARSSLLMGLIPVLIATTLGGTLGVIGGFAGRRVNTAVMRTMDVFYAFPSVLLAIAISGAMGGGMLNGMFALSLVFTPAICRIAETATAQVKNLDFIEAARASGAGTLTIIRHHVLGNVLGPVFIYASSLVSVSILLASGLSFLGLGVKPPEPDWGLMLAALRQSILCAAGKLCPARGCHLHHLDLFQFGERRHPLGHGCAAVSATAGFDQDRGGAAQPLLIATDLKKHFSIKAQRGGGRGQVRAVDGVSFTLFKGETLGVVGESGCGKSTLARLLLDLIHPDGGELIFDGEGVGAPDGISVGDLRRNVQMVFQDSSLSLNPRMPVRDSVAFGPFVHGKPWPEARRIACDMLVKVGLNPDLFGQRYPHELSGGQKQRVNIARALAISPRMVILDEAVSALDKSIEAQVLNLLRALKRSFNLTYLSTSHDLNVVQYISDRVLVMYLGQVVELGPADAIFKRSKHPYTRALLGSRSSMDPANRIEEPPITGDPPSPIDPPSGCRFRTRCPHAEPVCEQRMPLASAWRDRTSHVAACHLENPASGHSMAFT